MLEEILKYLSLITVSGAGISFIVGLVKYIDQRDREERNKRFEMFHGLMRSVAARGGLQGEILPTTQQAAAIYELQHFKEYSYASIPILEDLKKEFEEIDVHKVLHKATNDTIAALREPNRSKFYRREF